MESESRLRRHEWYIGLHKSAAIVPGYEVAMAYAFHTRRVFELDRHVGAVLAPLVDGSRTMEQIVEKLAATAPLAGHTRSEIANILFRLAKRGVLEMAKAPLSTGFGGAVCDDEECTWKLKKVSIELTDECNFHCPHCSAEARLSPGRQLPYRVVAGIIEQSRELGISDICLTGGEVFRRHDITKIINLIFRAGMSVHLITNGYYLSEKYDELLQSCVDTVQVSLYAADESGYARISGVRDAHERVTNNILRISRLRSPKIIVILPVLAGADLEKRVQFCREHKLETKFSYIARIGRARRNLRVLAASADDLETVLKGCSSPKTAKQQIFRRYPCLFDSIHIKPDGTMSFCPQIHGIQYHSGNIYRQRMVDFWNDPEFRSVLKSLDVDQRTFCRHCEYRYLCGGGCPGRSLLEFGSLQERFPYCQVYRKHSTRTGELF